MKKILIILISCLLAVSCSKDEKTQEEKEQGEIKKITQTLIGKWQVSRLANDIEFKEIVEINRKDCDINNYIEFLPNYEFLGKRGCQDKDEENGNFDIKFHNTIPLLHLYNGAAIRISTEIGFDGYLDLLKLEKNTFVLQIIIRHDFNYLEMKRID